MILNVTVGGDSGAWVIDNERGRVCGHVLAWCERNAITYICPMEIMLEDMKRTLHAEHVDLPGGSADEVMDTSTSSTSSNRLIENGEGLINAANFSRLSLNGRQQQEQAQSKILRHDVSPKGISPTSWNFKSNDSDGSWSHLASSRSAIGPRDGSQRPGMIFAKD